MTGLILLTAGGVFVGYAIARIQEAGRRAENAMMTIIGESFSCTTPEDKELQRQRLELESTFKTSDGFPEERPTDLLN